MIYEQSSSGLSRLLTLAYSCTYIHNNYTPSSRAVLSICARQIPGLLECKLKIITVLNFAQFSGKGRHALIKIYRIAGNIGRH